MKAYGLLLLALFWTSIMIGQRQSKKLKTDMPEINTTWQENHLPPNNTFDKHLNRFPKVLQAKALKNDWTNVLPSNSMPIHQPKGNFMMRVIPIDTIQKRYLKVYTPK